MKDKTTIIGAVVAIVGAVLLFATDGVGSTIGCVLIAAGVAGIGYAKKKNK